MRRPFKSGGIAAWSINHPIGISMLAVTVVVLGLFALKDLSIDLFPHIIYPEVRVRILDPGVPAKAMEDRITRQLEEQLAITENAISIQSKTREGRSAVDLSFPYGTDINLALRDASTRLDRAKRFLPTSIEPPVIYKRDPSQLPALEFVVSSTKISTTELRDWVDYQLSNWFNNLPGVAAAEVAGAPKREVKVVIDQEQLARLQLSYDDIIKAFENNKDSPGGEFHAKVKNINTRTTGRFNNLSEILELPIPGNTPGSIIHLKDIATISDATEDEKLRVRLNSISGVKLTIQKQPSANTTAVVDAVMKQLNSLQKTNIIPEHITINKVGDQSTFIRHALRNASFATVSGAILAMIVIYLFLGSVRRTLIIGTAIPLAILITFILMSSAGLSLNIMTIGGIALGVGLLVDNTIVMQENIARHQLLDANYTQAALNATGEINSAIIASTSTNLAAVVPFLFIGGIVGLLFSELILTLSAAIIGSLIVAVTLVPALSARVNSNKSNAIHDACNKIIKNILYYYEKIILKLIIHPIKVILFFIIILTLSLFTFKALMDQKERLLPKMDEGQIRIRIKGDSGMNLDKMDLAVKKIEAIIAQQDYVVSWFTTAGGFVFGRSEFQKSNYSSISIQLIERQKRDLTVDQWAKKLNSEVKKLNLVGFSVLAYAKGIRGFRSNRGDDDISIRIQGSNLDELRRLGDEVISKLQALKHIKNIQHSYQDSTEELSIKINQLRATSFGITTNDVSTALQIAMQGKIVSDYIDGDRQYNIRVRLNNKLLTSPPALANIVVGSFNKKTIRLRDVASINHQSSPTNIIRDKQRRIVEISASLKGSSSLSQALDEIDTALENFNLPKNYILYDGGSKKQLQEGENLGYILLALAIFLVFVVMAIQYESLRNPLIILCGVPFTIVGVIIGLLAVNLFIDLPISMPIKLGIIMLTGIVVNNAIVLIEQIENIRDTGVDLVAAVIDATKQRLRPILMTVLTTVLGMTPLAMGIGDGAEMLQPMAIVIVSGLSFSVLITLFLIPVIYLLTHQRDAIK
ncbi:Cobalt-zinc-cadmium resistance protein CzcA; Cation efflux system protein CusA [hydrothermal vent metagenome]|uniref:Cobalt-zinc-cadmium resistance protein CzcA Cation efflux system protein CusA n=1 Tax=hydrothermal vent metagenome TaxID=652676 RepID=A0A3B1A717_9ZZZZ